MTWDGDLRQQVLEEFREAQRRRGELAVPNGFNSPGSPDRSTAAGDEQEPAPPPASGAGSYQATAARPRRIVRRAA